MVKITKLLANEVLGSSKDKFCAACMQMFRLLITTQEVDKILIRGGFIKDKS